MTKEKTFVELGNEIGELLLKKNTAYGNSFEKAEDILKVLFPDGVPLEKYQDFLTVTRIIDKLFRIATDKNAFSEDPWRDIAGYAILSLWSQQPARKKELAYMTDGSTQDADAVRRTLALQEEHSKGLNVRGTETGRMDSSHPNESNPPHEVTGETLSEVPVIRKRLSDDFVCVSKRDCKDENCVGCEHFLKHSVFLKRAW